MNQDDPPLPPLAPGLRPTEEMIVTKRRRLAAAFQGVFGQPNRRSADQKMVLEHLREMCGRDKAIFQPDRNGNFDPLRAAQTDGAQTQYLIIKRQLAIARHEDDKAKTKPKTKR